MGPHLNFHKLTKCERDFAKLCPFTERIESTNDIGQSDVFTLFTQTESQCEWNGMEWNLYHFSMSIKIWP